MKKSTKPTHHILIKASTTSQWDAVDFAIIELNQSFKGMLYKSLSALKPFQTDQSFHNLVYWDSPLGYYCNHKSKLYTEEVIPSGADWAFCHLDTGDQQTLVIPKNELEGHQLMISKNGYANFKAFSKYTHEEYLTEGFLISEVLKSEDSIFIQ